MFTLLSPGKMNHESTLVCPKSLQFSYPNLSAFQGPGIHAGLSFPGTTLWCSSRPSQWRLACFSGVSGPFLYGLVPQLIYLAKIKDLSVVLCVPVGFRWEVQ